MLSAREAATSLYGAYRLARFDTRGMTYFETSLAGFWRSFYAAVIVAPFYAVLLVMRHAADTTGVGAVRFASVEAIAYVIAWVAFPLAMVPLARVLDREERYLGYIVAYNWASVLQNGVYLPLVMLGVAGTISAETAQALGLTAISLILVYTWFITKVALTVGAGTAAALVALSLVLSILVDAVASWILYLWIL